MNLKIKINHNITLLKLFNICYNFRLYSVLAVIYFAQVTHSYVLAISIFSVAQIAQAFFEIPTGIYSDKYGRSNCLRIGAFASLFSIISYAIADNFLVLVLGAIFEGLNRAAFSGNNEALIYETLLETDDQERYHHEFGKTNSWLELSGFISGIFGGLIAIRSLHLLFWLSIVPQLIGALISLKFTEPKIHREYLGTISLHLKDALKAYRSNLKLRYLSLASIIGFAIGESTWSFQSVFYNLFLPTWLTSFVMSLNFLTSAISFRLSGKIIKKFKATTVLLYQEIYGRILYLIALIFPSVASPFLMATASITYGPSTVAKSTLLQTEFSNQQRATMTSINSFVGNCLYAIVSILIGYFADKYGPTKSLLLGQICLISVVFLYLKLFSMTKNFKNPAHKK